MSPMPQDQRVLLERIAEESKTAMRNRLMPMKGIVQEIGVGLYDGMVRIRRYPHESPGDPERPMYYVVGNIPPIGATVWAHANHATGFVYGDFITDALQEVADSGTPVPKQAQLNLGDGITAADNPGAARTDIELLPSQKLATPSADGFMASADKTKINSVESGATADQSALEIFNAVKTLDGAGTDLDADTVDGSHASAFAAASHVGSGGTAHAGATQSVAGFLSATDKTKLDGMELQATGAFHAYADSAGTIPDQAYTLMGWNQESYDTEGWFDLANDRYVPQKAGLYIFGASIQLPALPAASEIWIKLYKNAGASRLMGRGGSTITSGVFDLFVSGIAICDANGSSDFFDMRVWQRSGASRAFTAHQDFTQFWGYYLGTL